MKQCLLIIGLLTLPVLKSFGQSPSEVSEDSVKQILCRKWIISRITVAGQPINTSTLATTYDFKPDYTVVCSWEKGVRKGIWKYDPTNQVINLTMKKGAHLYVKYLTANEFELATEMHEIPNELLPMKTYFKPN